jgi:hypothetical protein
MQERHMGPPYSSINIDYIYIKIMSSASVSYVSASYFAQYSNNCKDIIAEHKLPQFHAEVQLFDQV